MSLLLRYAPTTINEFVFEDPNVELALKGYANGQRTGRILLHGTYGAGKSTLARLIAKAGLHRVANPNNPEVINGIDYGASSEDLMISAWSWARTAGVDYPYVIIEDVDHLKAKQAKLRNLLDKPTSFGVILTTNEFDRVDRGLANRCQRYGIRIPTPMQWAPRAQSIMANEGVPISLSQAHSLLVASGGSIRDYGDALEDLKASNAMALTSQGGVK